ncbi:stage II sporulation protein M [Gleimia hominis]|uniref:stage II sporulation protein M n=1 Tax=Gleimia hominis TaxID=595468 RepID=UPI000C7FFD3F|nr:stage II sporulation protein M [Gleimia hominis]WIK64331.1 stage II sporulation protein M [Gleimia hominis]
MDLDAFVLKNRELWEELEHLSKLSKLDSVQAQRLVDLYKTTSTHLSFVRTRTPDPMLVSYLSAILGKARRRAGQTKVFHPRSIGQFFTRTFPSVLYQLRYWWITTMVVSVLFAFTAGFWLTHHPEVVEQVLGNEQVKEMANHQFEDYYSTYQASEFAAQVWTNNAWVSVQAIALGVTGVMVVKVLFENMMNLAVSGAVMFTAGKGSVFFGLILPHGMLEMTCVFVAAGAGLALFWSWVAPGARTRAQAFGECGRKVLMISLGLAIVLLLCGIIEAFVTPSPLNTAVRVGIGLTAWIGFMLYALLLGKRAYQNGVDGDIPLWQRDAQTVTAI